MRRILLTMLLLVLCLPAHADEALLRWGGDAEGGAPFVEADPSDPTRLRGFDVEIAEAIATSLHRRPLFVQVSFNSIDASVARGDFDLGMSGVEDTPARRAALAVTIPYFEFREVLAVRPTEAGTLRSLADFGGKKIATLGGTIAYDLLLANQDRYGYEIVSYDDDVHPYDDLTGDRVDAVLLDHIIAARSLKRNAGGFVVQPNAVATGHYVGVLAKENVALRDRINDILRQKMRDGTIEKIYRKWNIWDEGQAGFVRKMTSGGDLAATQVAAPAQPPQSRWTITWKYLPRLLAASVITIVLSCLAMALAIGCGVVIATGRVYGGALTRIALTAYVELVRGTPVLLQLFVLYYGLAAVIKLPAFVAALLGLGLNYGAYESEIYRGSLEAVPRGQLEAARILGFSEWQVLSLIRGPQAFRFALAPMTNDFVALLKDSSLVSVITVIELTKQTSIFAANVGSWVIPGILCAALYLAMSVPLSRLARRLETRWTRSS